MDTKALVALMALMAPCLAMQANYGYFPSAYSASSPFGASRHAARYAPPPVQLWSLKPSEVAELVSRIPLSHYREVSPNAPVAGRYDPAGQRVQEHVEVSQFHSQDGTGRAVFGYNSADQARVEARSSDGRVRGSYSYRDPTGKIVKVNYWDDGDGFHVAGNSLPSESDVPEPVTETPEVAAARRQHENMYAQALQASLQASLFSGNGEEPDQTRVEGPSGDLPPVYDEDGTELRRYPAPQHASLYDPSHVHDADRDAVIINNPDLEPDTFNDIQLFRTLRARARGYHPRGSTLGSTHARARRQMRQLEQQSEPEQTQQDQQEEKADGFFYSFRYPAPVLVGVPHPGAAPVAAAGVQDSYVGRGSDEHPLTLSQRAVYFGAIPVAAVHDAQVAPGHRASEQAEALARKPVYTETSA